MNPVPAIEVQDLSKTYHDAGEEHAIFKNLNFSVAAGEFIVLVGRSGSGKSTLLNLISGIDQADSGTITINHTPITHLSETERTLFRRHHIGFVFQSYNLIPTLTIEENLLLPLELIRKLGPEHHHAVQGILERLGLADRLRSFPDRLSGGEQQRVAIARALIHEPALVLADEPTGNLDLETGRSILDLLDGLVREAGKTLVMVTHSREVIGLADRVLSIANGRLEELCSPA